MKSKKVIQYDLDGNFIKIWNSMSEASNHNETLRKHICRACKINGTANKFMWIYYTDDYKFKINKYVKNINFEGFKLAPPRRMTFDDVKYIRISYQNKAKKLKDLALEYDVSLTSISNIINYKTYPDLFPKRIVKFNGGYMCVLCNGCRVIIYSGIPGEGVGGRPITKEDMESKDPIYCEKCQKNNKLQ